MLDELVIADPNPPFLADYDPAGRIIFAMTPNKNFFRMFEWVVKHTGRKIPKMLVSMFYIQGKRGPENIRRIRNLCDMLMVDSGVFSLRAKVYKDFDVSFHKKYWQTSEAERELMIEAGQKSLHIFEPFAHQYAEFLDQYGDLIDVAIDLDVDQFLGYPKAEEYYELLSKHIPLSKLMRVWHSPRGWEGWKGWCDSGLYSWLAMEGGWEHDRNVQMYTRFMEYAHERNIKVHVLAVTTSSFFRDVPFDTCDSSTYTVGGRWARLLMPNGRDVLVGENYKAHYGNHIDNLPAADKQGIVDLMHYFGFSLEELTTDHNKRCLFNILMFLVHYDKPSIRTVSEMMLF